MIPKKHGFEVCQELKRTPHGRRTPIHHHDRGLQGAQVPHPGSPRLRLRRVHRKADRARATARGRRKVLRWCCRDRPRGPRPRGGYRRRSILRPGGPYEAFVVIRGARRHRPDGTGLRRPSIEERAPADRSGFRPDRRRDHGAPGRHPAWGRQLWRRSPSVLPPHAASAPAAAPVASAVSDDLFEEVWPPADAESTRLPRCRPS